MKIMVPVKTVPDHNAHVKIKPDGSGMDWKHVKRIINPLDEIAVEEAVRMAEAGIADEVVIVSVGPESAARELRYAVAMGANRSVLIREDGFVDSDLTSRALAAIFQKEQFDLVLMGKQSIDSNSNQTAQLLAAYLDLPQASFVSKINITGNTADVVREVDGGLEMMQIPLPAVVSVDLRLNIPRYAPFAGIMKAKKRPMEILTLEDIGVSNQVKVKVIKYRPAAGRGRNQGKRMESVTQLVKVIYEEVGII